MDYLGFGLGTINSLFNVATSNANNERLRIENEKNRQFNAQQATLAYERQRQLIQDSPQLEKNGLVNAGLNPASLSPSFQSSVPTASSSSIPNFSQPDISPLLQGLSIDASLSNTQANTRKLNADAKSVELDNRAKEAEQNAWMQATAKPGYYLDDDGKRHYSTDDDFKSWADEYSKTHGSLPDLHPSPNIFSESAARIDSILASISNDLERYGAETAQNKVAAVVANSKLHDKSVMHALYNMDKAQYDLLLKNIDKANSEIDLNDYNKKYLSAQTDKARQDIAESIARTVLLKTQDKALRNSSVANLIDQLDSSKSFSENLVTIGKIILGLIQGNNILK